MRQQVESLTLDKVMKELARWDQSFWSSWNGRVAGTESGQTGFEYAGKMLDLLGLLDQRPGLAEEGEASGAGQLGKEVMTRAVSDAAREILRRTGQLLEDPDESLLGEALLRVLDRLRTCEDLWEAGNQNVPDQLGRFLDPRTFRIPTVPDPLRVADTVNGVLTCEAAPRSISPSTDEDHRRVAALIDRLDPKYKPTYEESIDEILENCKRTVGSWGMGGELRIVQWELLIRNLVRERESGEFSYRFLGEGAEGEIKNAMILSNEGMEELGRLGARLLVPTSIPSRETGEAFRADGQRKCMDEVQSLLNSATLEEHYPKARLDLVRMFSSARHGSHLGRGVDDSAVIVHDGEFSFYYLIWQLRCFNRSAQSAAEGTAKLDSAEGVKEQGLLEVLDVGLEAVKQAREAFEKARKALGAGSGGRGSIEVSWEEGKRRVTQVDVLHLLYASGLGVLIEPRGTEKGDLSEWTVFLSDRWTTLLRWLTSMATKIRWVVEGEGAQGTEQAKEFFFGRMAAGTAEEMQTNLDELAADTRRWETTLGPLLGLLPVKEFASRNDDDVRYSSAERRWIAVLTGFFLSEEPSEMFMEHVRALQSQGANEGRSVLRRQMNFGELLGWLRLWASSRWLRLLTDPSDLVAESLENEISGQNEAAERRRREASPKLQMDRLIVRLARVPYFPLEVSIRAFQVYPMHLLLLPQQFTPMPWDEESSDEEAPVSVAFATLVGHLPLGVYEHLQFGNEIQHVVDYPYPHWRKMRECAVNWLSSYTWVFSRISGECAARWLQTYATEAGLKEGIQEGLAEGTRRQAVQFAHELKRVIDAFQGGLSEFAIEEVGRYLRLFSLEPEYAEYRPETLDNLGNYDAANDTLSDLLERTNLFVTRIEVLMEKFIKPGQIRRLQSADDMEPYMHAHTRRLILDESAKSLWLKSCEDDPSLRYQKTLFIAMIAAGLANIYKNSRLGEVVDVWVEQDEQRELKVVVLRNREKRKGEGVRDARSRRGGTLLSIQRVAQELGEDYVATVALKQAHSRSSSGEDRNRRSFWTTHIPVPRDLVTPGTGALCGSMANDQQE